VAPPARRSQDVPAPEHRWRLRDKYLELGLTALTDEEVVELLLTLATPRRDCKAQAREAVKRFGGLRGVLEAEARSLTAVPGLGPKNVLGLKLIHDVARRFLRDRLLGRDFLRSARQVFDYFYHALRDRRQEVVQVAYLNAKHAVLSVEEPFEGGAAGIRIENQVLLRRALEMGAAGLVLVHNHPSGEPKPSAGDLKATRELSLACRALDLRLIDHLIIGDNRYFSFSEAGHLARFEDEFEAFKKAGG